MSVIHLYHLTTVTVIFALALSAAAGFFISYISGFLLWLTPEQQLGTFITGFALMLALTVTRFSYPGDDWRKIAMFDALPVLVCFSYFLPTVAAISAECPIFRAVFLINLCFGWTGIGWIAALAMALKGEERDNYDDLNLRITPFGVTGQKQIGFDARLAVQETPRKYIPSLRREL
jgi:hypothetical protein